MSLAFATLNRANAIQLELTTQPHGTFSRQLNQTIYEQAVQAASDARSENTEAPIYVIPADTGTGKTTFVCGLITALCEADPDYTAAYVVGTINEAQLVYDDLSKHLPCEALYIHTHAHGTADAITHARYNKRVAGHVDCHGPSTQGSLSTHRIIVCTHALWIKEGNDGSDLGIRRHRGSVRRSNVFVDELPEFTAMVETAPSDIAFLREQVERVPQWAIALPTLERIHSRMTDACRRKGARFETCHLLDRHEHATLSALDPALLNDPRITHRIEASLRFLDAASLGHSFLARGHHGGEAVEGVRQRNSFIAYRTQFRAHPGLVILDATAAISAFASLHRNVQLADVPSVNYANLALTNIEAPSEFKNIANRVAGRKSDAEYVGWVRGTVRENTDCGENVLIVVHKRHAEQLTAMDDQGGLKSRSVHYTHWGTGIGCNEWRKCTSVFLFSEYHLPRFAYLADALAMRGLTATGDELKRVTGQRMSGITEEMATGHRLRWFKQLACRGAVRQIDEDGNAGRMKLFTTMDRGLLMESYPVLFPNAPEPTITFSEEAERKTRGALVEEFLINFEELEICATEVARKLGLKVKEVARAFNSARCASLRSKGWKLIKGKGRAAKPMLRREPITIAVTGHCVTI